MQLQEVYLEVNRIPLFAPNENGILIRDKVAEPIGKKQTTKSLLTEIADRSAFKQV